VVACVGVQIDAVQRNTLCSRVYCRHWLAWGLLGYCTHIDLARVAVVSVYACKLTAKGSTDTAVWSMMKSVSKAWGTSLSTAPVNAITNVELLG